MKPSLSMMAQLAAAASAPAVDTVEPAPAKRVATPTRSPDHLANASGAIESRDWDGALREPTVAVREQSQNADVHNLLGYTYRTRASPDMAKAYEHYTMALKI